MSEDNHGDPYGRERGESCAIFRRDQYGNFAPILH
jgi:hypothetical protein